MALFIQYVVFVVESVDEILWCYHSNETSSAVLSHDITQDEVWKFLLKFNFGHGWL